MYMTTSTLPDAHLPIRTILVGTDFSERARAATDVAALLAASLNSELRIVHVLEPGPLSWLGSRQQAELRASVEAALDAEVSRLAADHTRPIGRAVLYGAPSTALADDAAEHGAAMIVVAAISRATSLLRIGGTAERLVQVARVPVLVVRDPAPLERWLRGAPLAVAAFLSDDAASQRSVEWLRVLRRAGACDVAALRAYYVDQATRRYGLAPRPLTSTDRDIEAYVVRDLEADIGPLGGRGELSLHPVLALGRTGDPLLASPASEAAALVVVGNHRSRGIARLSSVASLVVHAAHASILVVPSEAPPVAPAPWPVVRRVVVTTDLSPLADVAIRQAYGLVAATGGQVVLLHVMTAPGAQQSRGDILGQLRERIPSPAPRGVTTDVEAVWHEDAASAIRAVASRVGADAIVMASHGRSGVRRLVLGSVAQDVAAYAPAPVMIVRPPSDT
jgi:nucleotide-binding universal stress UspA family protein